MKRLFTAVTAFLLIAVLAFSFVACDKTPEGEKCTALCSVCHKCQNPDCKEHTEKCTCKPDDGKTDDGKTYDDTKSPAENLAANVSSKSISESAQKFVATLKDFEYSYDGKSHKEVTTISGLEIALGDGELKVLLTDLNTNDYDKSEAGETLNSYNKVNAKFATEGGKLYGDIRINSKHKTDKEELVNGGQVVISYEEAKTFIANYLKQQNTELYAELVNTVLPALAEAEVDDATIQKSLAFMDQVCADVAYSDGKFTVTISADKLKAFNDDLATLKIDRILDKYVGEGTYLKLSTIIDQLPQVTVGQVMSMLSAQNITLGQVYGAISKVAGIAGIEVSITEAEFIAMITAAKDQTLVAFICSSLDNIVTPELVTGMLTQVKDVMETSTVYEAIGIIYSLSDSSVVASEFATQIHDSIESGIDEYLSKIEYSLTIDLSGKLVAAHVAVKQLSVTETDNSGDEPVVEGTTTISFTLDVAFGGVSANDYSDVITEGKANDLSDKVAEAIQKNAISTDEISYKVEDGKVTLTETYSWTENPITIDGTTYNVAVTETKAATLSAFFMSAYTIENSDKIREYRAYYIATLNVTYEYVITTTDGTEVTDQEVRANVIKVVEENNSDDSAIKTILREIGIDNLCVVSVGADIDSEGKFSDVEGSINISIY